jgi:adenine phosphoribosyltransferase
MGRLVDRPCVGHSNSRFAPLDWVLLPDAHWLPESKVTVLAFQLPLHPPVRLHSTGTDTAAPGIPLMNLKTYIRSIPDFPKPGIMYRDITPLLKSAAAMQEAIRRMAEPFRDQNVGAVLAAEARGFVFGMPLAMELGAGFVPIRKPGKLPFETQQFEYDLEYGSDTLEVHRDAVSPGDRVLLVDDLLATGGTIDACLQLAQQQQATIVGATFLIELRFLKARDRLKDLSVTSLIEYHTESADE